MTKICHRGFPSTALGLTPYKARMLAGPPHLILDLRQAGFALFAKDLQGRYLEINEPGARMLGRSVEEVRYHFDHDVFEIASARVTIERDKNLVRSRHPRTFESLARADGRWTLFLTTKVVVLDDHGQPCGLIGLSGDVTNGRHHLNLDLFRTASERLKQNPNRFWTDMLAFLPHDRRGSAHS